MSFLYFLSLMILAPEENILIQIKLLHNIRGCLKESWNKEFPEQTSDLPVKIGKSEFTLESQGPFPLKFC